MIHPEQLGSRIAARRRVLGLTQGQVAIHMGVSPQAVSKWERGLACPDLVFLDDLAELRDIGLEDLLIGNTTPCLASA
jgi:transcriptional regulator with XRE-family HTH domain